MAVSLTEIVSLIVSLISIGVVLYKTRPEVRKMQGEARQSSADAAESFANAAATYALQVTQLQAKVEKQEKQISDLIIEVQKLQIYKRWAERLVLQIKSLGYEPVNIEPTVPKGNEA